ncbi:V8-like Glu-specific endopeptidase [Friedmanniella endophytica]|uniref:V8-like Glu-specific endopeptidase n=1 Tax=Microlunatus kandeliicorticis TaxID=1759536 RepID=A0A7W3P663_9ACTN|nr:trypsin-like serine protease [Microlunatus kandeliicorticis]MBA8794716.1 V8-like Glu-specific endopeptidase [Microlunatus kandeliicorticis]
MDDRPPRPTRPRWPRSARVTCAVLAAAVVVLGASLSASAVMAKRSAVAGMSIAGPSTSATGTPGPSAGRTPGPVQSGDVRASARPVPTVDAEQAMVGPLFPNGLSGSHSCTGTVVASSQGDTVLTAAHCISGSARGWLFAPGYEKGETPNGTWTVTGQYVTSAWMHDQSADDDFAVLTVAPRTIDGRSTTIATAVGAAQVSATPSARTLIRVIGYNAGRDDAATTCTVPLLRSRAGNPTFFCHGFVGGSSGSPWLLANAATRTIVGVIGGRHQGGCTEYTSHSAVFGSAVTALVERASDGGTPDDVPGAGSDNCPTT